MPMWKGARVYTPRSAVSSVWIPPSSKPEKTIINRWTEKYKMRYEMIEQSFIRAGSNASIPYCNGIIKSWSQKGYTTPKDLENEISNITQSKRNIDSGEDLIIKNITNVPVLDD